MDTSGGFRLGFAAVAVLLAAGVSAVVAEMAVRVIHPTPRVQVIRSTQPREVGDGRVVHLEVRDAGGVPVWQDRFYEGRRGWDCTEAPEGVTRVLVLGSSILSGVGLADSDVFSGPMQARLENVCVTNLAEPGFSFDQQWAVAQDVLPKLEPDVVIWEVWANTPWSFVQLGDTAYRFRHLEVDAEGLPTGLGLPSGLHRALLPRSRFYELAVLSLTPTRPITQAREEAWEGWAAGPLAEATAALEAAGVAQIWVYASPLNAPFDELAKPSKRGPGSRWDLGYDRVRQVVPDARHVDLVKLLADLDVTQIRRDTCCHFNEAGHQALAERLAPIVDAVRATAAPDPVDR